MESLLTHLPAVLELRSKGASFSLIARMLEHIGVHVSSETVRRLCVRSSSAPQGSHPGDSATASILQPSDVPGEKPKQATPSVITTSAKSAKGPRIADPSTQ